MKITLENDHPVNSTRFPLPTLALRGFWGGPRMVLFAWWTWRVVIRLNAPAEARCKASPPAGCSVWPCPTCGAVDMEDAGNKCKADWVCAADDQRQIDYEREQSTPNEKVEAPK